MLGTNNYSVHDKYYQKLGLSEYSSDTEPQ